MNNKCNSYQYNAIKEYYDIYVNTVKNRLRAIFAAGRHVAVKRFVDNFTIKRIGEAKIYKGYIKYWRFKFPDLMHPASLNLIINMTSENIPDCDSLNPDHTDIIKKAEESGIISYCQEAKLFWDISVWTNVADQSVLGSKEQIHIFSALMASLEEQCRMYIWECIRQKINVPDIISGIDKICNESIEILPHDYGMHWLQNIGIKEGW